MIGRRRFAENLIRRWVLLYTFGLPASARSDRRAEIESDLWEHRNYAAVEGEGPTVTSLSILGRWAAGLPADVSWRALQVRRNGRTTKEQVMTRTLGRYWWQAMAMLTAAATVYAGIRQFFTDEVSDGVSAGKVGALILFGGAGALILLGLATYRTIPRRGAAMVIIGVLPTAIVGGFGIGIVVGLFASLIGDLGWWWMPVGIASAVATAAGLGAFSAWWHAARGGVATRRPITVLPFVLVMAGLLIAGVGVSLGLATIPFLGVGAVVALIGAAVWSRRSKTAHQ